MTSCGFLIWFRCASLKTKHGTFQLSEMCRAENSKKKETTAERMKTAVRYDIARYRHFCQF